MEAKVNGKSSFSKSCGEVVITCLKKCVQRVLLGSRCNEYFQDKREPRATQLHLLTHNFRKNIPKENLPIEQHLAKFVYPASISAAPSNKFFKAKCME